MNDECFVIDVAQRIIDLVRDGCPISAVQTAIDRSNNEFNIGSNIGVVEDLFYAGFISATVISGAEE